MSENEFAKLYYIKTHDVQVLVVTLLEEPQQPTCEQDQPLDTTDKDD